MADGGDPPSSRSHDLRDLARRLMPGGVSSPVRAFKAVGAEPPIIAYGRGPRAFAVDGHASLDYVAAFGPLTRPPALRPPPPRSAVHRGGAGPPPLRRAPRRPRRRNRGAGRGEHGRGAAG